MTVAWTNVRLLTLLAFLVAVFSCDTPAPDDGGDPRYRAVAGAYAAVSYTEYSFFSSCAYFDALARGGFFQMRLDEDGSVQDGRYFIGVDGPRDRSCDPLLSSEISFHGAFTLSGDTLVLDLDRSCQEKWHQSKWLIAGQTLVYLGFDVGRGPCRPEVTLKR